MSKSIITLKRRIILTQATSGKITTTPPITHIAFGDGGVDENNEPLMPDEKQTTLNHELARYHVDSVTYPIETTSQYTVTIPKADLVRAKISEMGLIDKDGNLCAIQNMFIKQKDDSVNFTFEFNDEF